MTERCGAVFARGAKICARPSGHTSRRHQDAEYFSRERSQNATRYLAQRSRRLAYAKATRARRGVLVNMRRTEARLGMTRQQLKEMFA